MLLDPRTSYVVQMNFSSVVDQPREHFIQVRNCCSEEPRGAWVPLHQVCYTSLFDGQTKSSVLCLHVSTQLPSPTSNQSLQRCVHRYEGNPKFWRLHKACCITFFRNLDAFVRSFVDADDQPDIYMLRVARTWTPLVFIQMDQ